VRPAGAAATAGDEWWRHESDGTSLFRIAREPFVLDLHAQLQLQAVPWVGDDALLENLDPAQDAGFRVRRARIGFSGRILREVSFDLLWELFNDVDLANHGQPISNRLLDATIGWHRWSWLQVEAGAGKVPFARSVLTSSAELQFAERPYYAEDSDLVPERRVGATLVGELGMLRWAGGVYNGSEGLSLGNRFAGLLYAARLEVEPFGPVGQAPAAYGRNDPWWRGPAWPRAAPSTTSTGTASTAGAPPPTSPSSATACR